MNDDGDTPVTSKLNRQPSTVLLTPGYSGAPTIGINLQNVSHADIIQPEDHEVQPQTLAPRSHNSANSVYSFESEDDTRYDDQDLLNIFSDLMIHNRPSIQVQYPSELTSLNWNVFSDVDTSLSIDEFIAKYVSIDKLDDSDTFHGKLKHFFILSSAGKPIYSLNGSDDVILGYMGLITTIVSTFAENMKEEFKSINYGGNIHITVLNRDPLILLSITKINHELSNDGDMLVKQLTTLYDYLLSILSKPAIVKNFHNRMNYDLRRMLTPMDLHNFDSLCMKLTYGISLEDQHSSKIGYFISELLGKCLQSVKITNTTRQKLNSILLSSKKLKSSSGEVSAASSIFHNTMRRYDKEVLLGIDLLFSFLVTDGNKIVTMMKPKNHNLTNKDIQTLLSTVEAITHNSHLDNETTEDSWIPLCMPNFNPNGFLYIFIKQFDLADVQSQPFTIILVSGNKNSFHQMQQISEHIIYKITKEDQFRDKLIKELLASKQLSILHDLKVPVIKHFIYKLKAHNQFIMSDLHSFRPEIHDDVNKTLQLIHFYSTLYHTKSTTIKSTNIAIKDKKLTYTKWQVDDHSITGFMLSNNEYEFYCLCNELIHSQHLIDHSLKIIKWCDKYHKRLFIEGVVF